MNEVALLIGGNQGDRQKLIEEATALIRMRIGAVVALSSIVETEPWGDFGDEKPQKFMNRAMVVHTEMEAREVLRVALEVEKELGRIRAGEKKMHYSNRPMDIDIIFFNDQIIEEEDLCIPHPRMHLREFVLEPLAEIMPEKKHPVFGKSVVEMLRELRGGV